jgi:hypothetical protein
MMSAGSARVRAAVWRLAAIFSGDYTDAMALSTLLTVESLLFAALSVAVGLSGPTAAVRNLQISPRALGMIVAAALGFVALGGFLCWTGIFLDSWPCDIRGALVALIIAGAIIGQPIVAWVIARGLGRRATRTGGNA